MLSINKKTREELSKMTRPELITHLRECQEVYNNLFNLAYGNNRKVHGAYDCFMKFKKEYHEYMRVLEDLVF